MLKCPYCLGETALESSKKIYNGADYGPAYICENWPECDSYVGVHSGTTKPKGTLANAELRDLRKEVHALFDIPWKNIKGRKDRSRERSAQYRKLANELKIDFRDCHIGTFDIPTCIHAIRILEEGRA